MRSITQVFTPLLFSAALLFLTCCESPKSPAQSLDYSEEINRQFWSADWSSDGEFIAVGGADSLLRIYNNADLSLLKTYSMKTWIHVIKWNPDNVNLAVATLDKEVQLINVETDSIIVLFSDGGSRAIGWNHDGTLLAVGDLEGGVTVWSQKGIEIGRYEPNYEPDAVGTSYLGLDWHPTKNVFVALNFKIRLFDAVATELIVMDHVNPEAIMLCVDWHPSGDYFVIGDYGHNWEGENVPSLLHFWSHDGKWIKSLHGSKAEYRNLAWNQNGTLLATASDVLRIWATDGNILHISESDSTNYLWGVCWSPSGEKLVTASRFKTVALWDKSAKLIKRVDDGNN